MQAKRDFNRLVGEADQLNFEGWDFSSIAGRWREQPPFWDYRQIVSTYLPQADSLLDMGTGGGEFLASLPALPPHTCATENYPPNVPVARKRLEPLGVQVTSFATDQNLPFADAEFALVINRHESYDPVEVRRILRPGGIFITQQVGGRDNLALNQHLLGHAEAVYEEWYLANAVAELEAVGFTIYKAEEDFPPTQFYDIGAVIFYLQAIPWQIPGFCVEAYREQLFALHKHILDAGALTATSHRFLIIARR